MNSAVCPLHRTCRIGRITVTGAVQIPLQKNNLQGNECMSWKNPPIKQGVVRKKGVETTPFVFMDRFYLLENFGRFYDFPGQDSLYRFHEDGFRIRDVELDAVISVPLLNHYYATAFPWENTVYVYAVYYGWDSEIKLNKQYMMLCSDDLITWSKPEIIIEANERERLYNNAVVWDGNRFVMLIETSDPTWPKFTFKFYESPDLRSFTQIPDAYYGVDKYVGGPAMYFSGGYYYVLYLNSEGKYRDMNSYRTRITRSRDLITWEDAPQNRPFVDFDPSHMLNEEERPGVFEVNASDVELCEWQGKTVAYFAGGNQRGYADVQLAEYDGTMKDLFEAFFT